MNMRRLVLSLVLIGGAVGLSVPASAAEKKKSFDLYSWAQEGNVNYCYALVPSSKERLAAAEIKASKDLVCGGSGDLKRIVGQAVPLGSKLTWKTDEANGFVLPSRDIVNDFQRFSMTMPYKFSVVEGK
jgi:hypothetical protein